MSEMQKLEKYLKEHHYRFEKIKKSAMGIKDFQNQIFVYDENGEIKWDVICHVGSYGYEQGLLEIMGSIVKGIDSVEGFLTADDIIKRLEEQDG